MVQTHTVVGGVLIAFAMLECGAAFAMGSADHDLARDMATKVYGVPYDPPATGHGTSPPEAAARTAPEGRDAGTAGRGCDSAKPSDCREKAPPQK